MCRHKGQAGRIGYRGHSHSAEGLKGFHENRRPTAT
jgi:hypothetical protein